jgi:hypothetical protein
MKKQVATIALLAIFGRATQAHAIGCLWGAVAGGVAGHYAGHHAVLSAIGGCTVCHHLAVQKKLQKQQQQLPAQPVAPATRSVPQ